MKRRRLQVRIAATKGFSLIEVLMAMALLVVVVAGLLPLFTRSVLENLEGKESTLSVNHARSELETQKQLSFQCTPTGL